MTYSMIFMVPLTISNAPFWFICSKLPKTVFAPPCVFRNVCLTSSFSHAQRWSKEHSISNILSVACTIGNVVTIFGNKRLEPLHHLSFHSWRHVGNGLLQTALNWNHRNVIIFHTMNKPTIMMSIMSSKRLCSASRRDPTPIWSGTHVATPCPRMTRSMRSTLTTTLISKCPRPPMI